MKLTPSAVAASVFFALLPAASVGGAMGLPLFLCLAAGLSFSPGLIAQLIENRPLSLILILLFWAWILITTAWSPVPGHVQAMKLAALVPLGLLFAAAATTPNLKRLTQAFGIASFLVLAALLAIEALWDMPLNRLANPDIPPGELVRNVNRGAGVVLAITFGAAASLIANDRINTARLVWASSALLALPFGLWANLAAFVAGLIVFGIALNAQRFALMTTSAGLAIWMLAAPFATPIILANQSLVDALPLSWAARAGIWDYVCARIVEQPWIGHGLDASRAVTDRIQVRELDMRGIPLHPHSASLQIWYETGAVGAVLAAAALLASGFALTRVFEGNRVGGAAAAATLASLGIMAYLSFGVWQEWWIATWFVTAALVGALAHTRDPESARG